MRSVLICDADPDSRAALSADLAELSVVEAPTSGAARAQLAARAFSAIVCEVTLEQPSDGLELLRYVRAIYPTTIRILISASRDLEEITREVSDGVAHRYLGKPWDSQRLRALLGSEEP
jgi:two-component system, NtrC family, response regulator HupR/HoxA